MWPPPKKLSAIHRPYTRLRLLALSRKSELRQRPRLFRCAACKWVFTGGATKSKVWCCQSEITIPYTVDVILTSVTPFPSLSLPRVFLLVFIWRRRVEHWHFSSLKTPYLYFVHVSSTFFISSAFIFCAKFPLLFKEEEYLFSLLELF